MKKFKIAVSDYYNYVEVTDVEVEAETREEAEKLAIERAFDMNYTRIIKEHDFTQTDVLEGD